MKRSVSVVVGLLAALMLALGLSACSSGDNEANEETWQTLTVSNASISYPSSWVVIDADANNVLGGSLTEAKGVSPAADSETAVVLADMTQSGVDLDTMETGLAAMDYSPSRLTLAGCEAIAFSLPVGDVTAQAYIIQAGERMLMLLGSLNPEDDDTVKAQYQQVIDSFQVTGSAAGADDAAAGEGDADGDEAAEEAVDEAETIVEGEQGEDPNAEAQGASDAQQDAADMQQDEDESGE